MSRLNFLQAGTKTEESFFGKNLSRKPVNTKKEKKSLDDGLRYLQKMLQKKKLSKKSRKEQWAAAVCKILDRQWTSLVTVKYAIFIKNV